MRNYWLTCAALALLVVGLLLAPLRLMRRARAQAPQQVVTKEAPPPSSSVEPAARAAVAPPPRQPADRAPAPLLIDFGGDEAEAEAEEVVQGNEPPPLSAKEAEAAKKNLEWAMRGLLPEINGCYQQALTRDPKLRGELAIEMTLAPAGLSKWAVVEDAVIADNNLQAPLLEQCLLIAVSKLRMERPAGRLYITYPLRLQPSADQPTNRRITVGADPEFEVGEGTINDGDDGDDD